VLTRYGSSPAFYRYRGVPVIFVYGRAVGEMSRDQWKDALDRVRKTHRVFVVGDGEDPALYSVFDALHTYNPVGAVVQGADMKALYQKLTEQAKNARRVSTVTVIPGYDDSHVGRPKPIIAPREKGRLYLRLWNDALDADPDWVVLTTFNEWHEGSEIEPSVEFGDDYLQQTARFSQFFKSGKSLVPDSENESRLKGWGLSADARSRFAYRALPGGGISLTNLSGGTGEIRLKAPDGKEPYLFQVGREGRLWRVLPPDKPKNAKSSDYRYAISFDTEFQAWTAADFAKVRPDSPFAEMAKANLHLDLASQWASDDANRWRTYPDGPFPIVATLRNKGSDTLKAGEIKLASPEGWGQSNAVLDSPLRPEETASIHLSSYPDAETPIGGIDPIFVWATLTPDNGKPIRFQNNLDIAVETPLNVNFAFGEKGEVTARLENRFPGHRLFGEASFLVSKGRVSETKPSSFAFDASTDLQLRQRLPDHEAPQLRKSYAFFTLGGYHQIASAIDTVTVDLGLKSDDQGLTRVDAPDGVVERITIPAPNGSAEKAIPALKAVLSNPGQLHYVYFDMEDDFPASAPVWVRAEYLDQGTGSMMLQYDSTDPKATLDGRYKSAEKFALTNTGEWKSFDWRIDDAKFANRQNGGADFRLEMGPEPIVLRRVTVSKWPIR
jgi:hypothetical protein